jgi:hypothetical protein
MDRRKAIMLVLPHHAQATLINECAPMRLPGAMVLWLATSASMWLAIGWLIF